MIPRFLAWLLGASWHTSLTSFLAGLALAAEKVPVVLDGTATGHDYVRFVTAALVIALGRAAADANQVHKEDKPS